MGRIYKRIKICGKKRCIDKTAEVDTGSPETIIDEDIAYRIGAVPTGEVKTLRGIGEGVVRGYEVYVDIEMPEKYQKGMIKAVAVSNAQKRIGTEVLIGTDYAQERGMELDITFIKDSVSRYPNDGYSETIRLPRVIHEE